MVDARSVAAGGDCSSSDMVGLVTSICGSDGEGLLEVGSTGSEGIIIVVIVRWCGGFDPIPVLPRRRVMGPEKDDRRDVRLRVS